MIRGAGTTDAGKKREHNEDDFLVLEPEKLFMVCDGVGGQADGEKASRMVTDSLRRAIEEEPPAADASEEELYNYFSSRIQKANEAVYRASTRQSHTDNTSMATTMVLAYIIGQQAYIINVGDSRCYLVRSNRLTQLTRDHTYVNQLVETGTITEVQAEQHPGRHMITRALGAEKTVEPDYFTFPLEAGDRLILCSDGLYNELSAQAILRLATQYPSPGPLSRLLVGAANEEGGEDNITAVCIQVTEQ